MRDMKNSLFKNRRTIINLSENNLKISINYDLNASTGSNLEALHAGYHPKNNQVTTAKKTAVASPLRERSIGKLDPKIFE